MKVFVGLAGVTVALSSFTSALPSQTAQARVAAPSAGQPTAAPVEQTVSSVPPIAEARTLPGGPVCRRPYICVFPWKRNPPDPPPLAVYYRLGWRRLPARVFAALQTRYDDSILFSYGRRAGTGTMACIPGLRYDRIRGTRPQYYRVSRGRDPKWINIRNAPTCNRIRSLPSAD